MTEQTTAIASGEKAEARGASEEAKARSASVPSRRRVEGITVDAEETRDIDDAIWIEPAEDGAARILVSISDVAETVRPGSKTDLRAREMTATRYFASGNSPMLPRQLSEDALSLWPGKERQAITIEVLLGPSGEVLRHDVYQTVLTSRAQASYARIPAILADPGHEGHAMLALGCRLALALLDRRRKAGALVLYDLNAGWIMTEEGYLRQLEKKEETIGHILVQELMVLTNSIVAERMVRANVPVLFRNHSPAAAAPSRELLMAEVEMGLTGAIPPQYLDAVRERTHMLLGRASYSATLLGHYGLNLPAYLHFTSPIRRYADLVNHRQIKAHLAGKPCPYSREEVDAVAVELNSAAEKERSETSAHFKARDEELARRAVDARMLDGLDAARFERVAKVEARSGKDPSSAFLEAFVLRLRERRMPLVAVAAVVTQENLPAGWRSILQAIAAQLARTPEDAVSLLAMTESVAGWPSATYEASHEGPDHLRTFACRASLLVGGRELVEAATGSTSKLAKQRAAVLLLAAVLGVEPPHLPEGPKKLEQVSTAKKGRAAMDRNKDPVSALMEHAAQSALAPPSFAFERQGPDHVPVITCSCRFGDVLRQAQAGSKQDAKKRAAAAVLESIMAGANTEVEQDGA